MATSFGGFSVRVAPADAVRLLDADESHFLEFKAREVAPGKLSQTLSSLANASGGEIYVGISDQKPRTWHGFAAPEEANAHLQILNQMFPLGKEADWEFLSASTYPGQVLHITVRKTPEVKLASNGLAYIRVSAQSQAAQGEMLERLKLDKGVVSFEDSAVPKAPLSDLSGSAVMRSFLSSVIPRAEAEPWLRKQQLVRGDHPTVAAVLLFTDEPQIYLPKRSAIKLYRYKTSASEGTRDTLAFDPITIEGCTYKQIAAAVDKTVETIQGISVLGPTGLEQAKYPREALHEIVTNAVLHRDYSIPDDIDIRIFDNRIEVESPGRLPGHITLKNILREQFARNPTLVRIVNKFPEPPNKDVGEGLNTAFEAMRKLRLKEPEISEQQNSVIVNIRHEPLASYEELIMDYLEAHDSIANSTARRLCHVGSESVMQKVFRGMIQRGMIEPVPGKRARSAAYRRKLGQRVPGNDDLD